MSERWQTIIRADQKRIAIDLKELWRYRDLIRLYVKRSFKITYQQTILGPFWIILNPLFSTIVFTVIFGNIAKFSTDTIPKFVFYMAGNTTWNLFAYYINANSNVFLTNRDIFDKVYFPRIVMPISSIFSCFLSYLIQFSLFIVSWIYYLFQGAFTPSWAMLLVPLLWLEIAVLGTSMGLIISSVTKKYRDLHMLVGFGVALLMYLTPVVYPLSEAGGYFRLLLQINPMGPIIETFRYAFFGVGTVDIAFLILGLAETLGCCWLGLNLFTKTERMVMDTI